ncbi:MAG TPA: subclass B3 metallo-beta-lactamase [Allosphingosinicella sp.]|nr:subclass B3 metallo-beta-lactamase [Allosphingosinicella sp.]
MIQRALFAFLASTAAILPAAGANEPAEAQPKWNKPIEPFRIAGNLYYVGTAGLAAYLLTDPAGHVLIDGAMPQSADLIAANIGRLGFRVEDVEIILNNHAHLDHAGGLARLKSLSGARLLASAADRPALESGTVPYRDEYWFFPPVPVDRIVADGEIVRLGASSLTAHLTPGHTRGCTTWTTRVIEQGRPLDVMFACSLTVAGQPLVNDHRYPEAAVDFAGTFARLRRLSADIFLGFHGNQFDLDRKRARLGSDPLAFVDPGELRAQVDRAEAGFQREMERQRSSAAEE